MARQSKLIQRRHPRYDTMVSRWDFFELSYLGGQDYINAHLFQYFKEGDEEFKKRVERAYRENHSKRVVDLINSYLFKVEATRTTTNKYVQALWDNFDGKDRSVGRAMKTISQWASVFGRLYLLIDKPELPEEERTGTQRDNIDGRAMPYVYWINPQDVLDISFDEDGKIRWALIRESIRDDEDPYESSGELKEQFRLWLPDGWELYDDKGDQIESGQTGIGRVPMVIVDSEENDQYTGQSLIGDIAYLDRAIFNNWSRLDVIVNDQTFSQLCFPIEGLPAEVIENEELRKQFLTLATNRVILYSAQAQIPPAWIAPDASQAQFILAMIERQTKQLYSSLGLENEVGEETKAQSGVAKSYDFDKLNKLLASKADNLESAEKEIVEIFTAWTGITAEAEIEYPDEFDVKSLADEIAMAQELALLDISETFKKEVDKIIAQKVLKKADEKTIKQVLDEIEKRDQSISQAAQDGNLDFGQNITDRINLNGIKSNK